MTGMKTEMKFFIYGSLSEGSVHFHKIKNFIFSSQPAWVQGTVYRLKVGFPVLLMEGQDLVPGHVIQVHQTDLLLSLLDEFHGYNRLVEAKSLYLRRQIEIKGTDEKAWTYVLNPVKLPSSAVLIAGGDWKQSLQDQAPLTEKLTERQKSYILRLGRSGGRDIVPIDLQLYRELMNLEMIVDKGRRLALSKTGNEVYRYLS